MRISKFFLEKVEPPLSNLEERERLERSYLIGLQGEESPEESIAKIQTTEEVTLCQQIRHQIAHQIGFSLKTKP